MDDKIALRNYLLREARKTRGNEKKLGLDIALEEFEILLEEGAALKINNRLSSDNGYVHKLSYQRYTFKTFTHSLYYFIKKQ
ncbi:MAG: hypothetical protein AABX16_02180 [Nanoarchaeota archaeon]